MNLERNEYQYESYRLENEKYTRTIVLTGENNIGEQKQEKKMSREKEFTTK